MRKTTLLDIAQKIGLSKTTVSMVLNNKPINVSDETRDKIFKVADELNYIPNSVARSLCTKKSYTLGCIIPDIQNPFFGEMAKAIEIEAEKHGYSIMLCNTFNSGKKEEEYIKLLISKLVDGVIIVPSGETNKGRKLLKENKIPFVIVDRRQDQGDITNGVFCDNKKGIELGVEYLLKKGNNKIAFVSGKEESIIKDSRLESFRKIAKKYDSLNDDLIERDSFSLQGGMNATERLINKKIGIDAIFYSSDIMAIGGIKTLIRNGYKIPDDIQVLGYDNIDICSFIEPELTTIAQPIYEMGKKSCDLIIDIIDEKVSEGTIINLTPTLIERETIKK